MLRPTDAIIGFALAVLGCGEISGVEVIPCQPACKDEATRIVCDAAGNPRTEACPTSTEACAAPACEAGACTFKPAVGAPCGETGAAHCNEGFACMGGYYRIGAILRNTCVATDDGKVWCWGDNSYGQLGDGTTRPGLHPILVRGLPGRAMAAHPGYRHACAVLQSGEVYCWGDNRDGQCGVPEPSRIEKPVLVDAPVRLIGVMAGQGHTCAVAEDGTVYCWGNTRHGQCGIDPALTGKQIAPPTKIDGVDSVVTFTTVKNHTCVVRSIPPTLMCWGSNSNVEDVQPYVNHKLGPGAGDLPYSAAPVEVDLGAPVIYPGMGLESTYAVTEDGRVYAWGSNDRLQLGTGHPASQTIVSTPSPVMIVTGRGLVPLTGVVATIRSNGSDLCAMMRDRTDFGTSFVCWGVDDWGEIGAGTPEGAGTTHRFPVPVRALPGTADWLGRGEDHACAGVRVDERTEIWCYGRPGVLGNGTERSEGDVAPSQWLGTPVVWDPANFAPALE